MIKNNKLKNIKGLIIAAVILFILGLGGYFIYVNVLNKNIDKKPTDDGTKSNVNEELQNVIQFAYLYSKQKSDVSTGKLIAIKDTGEQIQIYEWEQSFIYDKLYIVSDNIVYISDYDKDNNKYFFGSIDLNKGDGNYKLIKIKEDDIGSVDFTVINDNIYYILFNEQIHEFNIKTKIEKVIKQDNSHPNKVSYIHNILSDENTNSLVYVTQIDDEELYSGYVKSEHRIYIYNLNNNKETEVCLECYPEFTHNGKLIYSLEKDDFNTYYEYDINSKKAKKILNLKYFGGSISDRRVIPFNNGYAYIEANYNNNKTYVFKIDMDGKKELIYTFNDFYPNVLLSIKNKLIFSQYEERMDDNPNVETKELDILTKKVFTISNHYYCNIQPVYFK